MVYDFLEKLLKDTKNKALEGLEAEFLKSIGKTSAELKELIINLGKIDSGSLLNKITPKVIKRVIPSDDSDLFRLKEIKEIKQFKTIYPNLEIIKRNIMEIYLNNIITVTDFLNNLRNTPINLLIDTIDKNVEELKNLKSDFELKMNSILELNQNQDSNSQDEVAIDNC